ncbi:MAG: PLP-dependent aminotransferase family protein [Paracoccaceae bacterium]|nr:MAG: PLP-dependent aminotransferase family protein [Paracoccaceae bacterium]
MADTNWANNLQQYDGPKYLALARALREAIRDGRLVPGAQLPTVRDLAWELKVTPGTVSRAYQIATQEGLLAATVGRGTFVAAAAPRFGPTASLAVDRDPARVAGKADLRSPRLPDVGQGEAIAAAFAGLAATMRGDWLDYPFQRGEAPLREAVAQWLADRQLGPVTGEDVALAMGGQNAIVIVLACVLRGDRPHVLIEDLAYPGFRHAARAARAEVVGIDLDQHGLRPDALDAACRRHPAQVLCLTPEAQNPTGVQMPAARRDEIVAVARAHDLQIIEDDCYTPAQADLPAIRALAPERTWHVGSLSKTVSAALRFGWVACPQGMGHAARLTAQHSFFALARPVSDLCLSLFTSGEAARLRAEVGAVFADQLEAVVTRLGNHDLQWQQGLPFVWLTLPSGWRASTFTRMAEAEGVLLRSADEFALIGGRAPHAVRLALNGQLTRDATEAACATLARLLLSPPAELSV